MVAEQKHDSGPISAGAPKIEVKYYGSIRESAGMPCERIDCAPTTVTELLGLLSDAHGLGLREQLLDGSAAGGLRDDLMVTVNEAIMNHDAAANAVINPGDVVALFPTFPGGG